MPVASSWPASTSHASQRACWCLVGGTTVGGNERLRGAGAAGRCFARADPRHADSVFVIEPQNRDLGPRASEYSLPQVGDREYEASVRSWLERSSEEWLQRGHCGSV
jgi:hypothetical protein